MTDADKERRVEAIAKWMYDFDSDGKPHRPKWDTLHPRDKSGFVACAFNFVADDPLNSEHAKLTASHAEAVALLGECERLLSASRHHVVSEGDDSLMIALDDLLERTRLAKVGA